MTISATSITVTATARISEPERVADPVGDDLGVVHRREDGADEDHRDGGDPECSFGDG